MNVILHNEVLLEQLACTNLNIRLKLLIFVSLYFKVLLKSCPLIATFDQLRLMEFNVSNRKQRRLNKNK